MNTFPFKWNFQMEFVSVLKHEFSPPSGLALFTVGELIVVPVCE